MLAFVSGAKRQHYVPRSYLTRFASDDKVFVRRRDGKTFTANCRNVAVETGFYDIDLPSGDKSKVVEETLADVEDATARAMRVIDDAGEAPAPATSERETLAVFLALQLTRTPETRERLLFPQRLAQHLDGREVTREAVRSYLTDHHLGFAPSDREVEGAWTFAVAALQGELAITREDSMRLMPSMVTELAPRLNSMWWSVEHDRKGRLMTSDSPFVMWRTPTDRDEFEGFGIDNAEELRFPLDPSKQLVLSRTARSPAARVAQVRVATCNQDMAFASHTFLVGHPKDRQRIEALELPTRRPILRFNVGPLLRRLEGGQLVEDGEMLHMWVPRR
jgi:hypothetical protein